MTVCFCVSLFNHLCCFTLRTDGFGNLPSGGRTKTRKTFQAGRFKNEKRKDRKFWHMKSPCDDVCINDQQTNGFASVQFWNCTARVPEVAPASAASVWWVQSRLHSEEKASQVNLVALDSIISRSFGRIVSVSCFHSHFSFQRVAAFATIQVSCLATACQLRYFVASVGKLWLCMQSCHGLR